MMTGRDLTAPDLNETEMSVLRELAKSSEGNGHDFGFTDEISEDVCSKKQRGGYVSQLTQKDYIDVEPPYTLFPGHTVVQFTLTAKACLLLDIDRGER